MSLHHLFSLSLILSMSVCLFEELSDDAVCIVQLESACRAGYIISCNVVTSHTRLPYHLLLEPLYSLQGCHIIHINIVIAALSASRKVSEKGQVALWRSAMLWAWLYCGRMTAFVNDKVESVMLGWAIAAQVLSLWKQVTRIEQSHRSCYQKQHLHFACHDSCEKDLSICLQMTAGTEAHKSNC